MSGFSSIQRLPQVHRLDVKPCAEEPDDRVHVVWRVGATGALNLVPLGRLRDARPTCRTIVRLSCRDTDI